MVYNDIEESNYSFKYDKLLFYFSSRFYEEKFVSEYANFLKEETIKLKLKYKCIIEADELILLLLYKKIEKRGFKVLYDDRRISDQYYITCKIDNSYGLSER